MTTRLCSVANYILKKKKKLELSNFKKYLKLMGWEIGILLFKIMCKWKLMSNFNKSNTNMPLMTILLYLINSQKSEYHHYLKEVVDKMMWRLHPPVDLFKAAMNHLSIISLM